MAPPSPEQQPPPREPDFLLHQDSAIQEFWALLKGVFKPEKQPELVLESKPIPVKDIWARPRSLKSRLSSVAVHLAVIGILMLPFWRPVQTQIKKVVEATELYVPPQVQPPMPKMRRLAGGGSPLPKPQLKIVQTPKVQPITAPTVVVPVQEAVSLPSFGNLGAVAGPPGSGGGANGGNGGTGSGNGGGDCTGNDCGSGYGVAASSPIPVYEPDPEYSDAARKAKFQGTCIVQVTIGADGRVSHPKVVQPLGLGLDEKAIQAVLLWRFEPARDKNGKPIAVQANVEVNFRLY